MVRELSQSDYHRVTAQDPNIRQLKPVFRPHRHIGHVPGQVFKLQGRSLDGNIQLLHCLRRVQQVPAAYRTMPPTTAAITSWGTDAGPKVFLHQPRRPSQQSTCFSFMDAIPFGLRRGPVRHCTLGLQSDPQSLRIARVQAYHDQGDASGGGLRTLADVEGHANVCQVLRHRCRVLQEMR